jgi:hypothetical protein
MREREGERERCWIVHRNSEALSIESSSFSLLGNLKTKIIGSMLGYMYY